MTKNINYVSHKKSKLKTNDGKPQLPSASALVEGEIAINYAEDVETLSIKNESGTVVTFSSDNYYTEQKLGSAFTGSKSATTVTDVTNSISGVANAAAVGVLSLKENKADLSAFTSHTASTVHMTDTEKTNLDSLATNIGAISGITSIKIGQWDAAAGVDMNNYYQKTETSGATELSTAFGNKADSSDLASLSGTVTAHTANTDIHVTTANKTAWDAKADLSDIPSVTEYADSVKYNSTSKEVEFYHGGTSGTKVFSYDASPFLIDGMVQNVEIKSVTSGESQVTCLVISFNTDAGKQDINIPISQIFDANNYYTTAQTDTKITEATSGKVDNTTYTAYTAATATEIGNKLATSDFNTYSGTVNTSLNSKASQSDLSTLSGTVTAHTADGGIHVTTSDKTKWNKIDDKADITAVTEAIDAAVSGKTNQSDFSAHTANTDIHVTVADKTKWNNKSDFSGSYNDLTDKPTIPSKTSDLTNDSDFATSGYVQAVTSDMATKTWVSGQGYLISADIEGKQDISGMTAYTTTATTNELSGTVTAHTANTEIHVTTEDKSKWNNVDNKLNTSDFNTYSGAVDTAISNKVDKVEGKGLSTNDFTNELKTKLDGIAEGAEVNVQANWNESDTTSDSYIQNKPTLGTAAAKGVSTSITNSDNLIEAKHIYSGVGVTVAYDSESHYIQLKNTAGSVLSSFDASAFLVDGMVDSVELESKSGTTYLVVTWNTAAGKTKTELNIGDIFEADNYYTKSETSGKTEISTALDTKVNSATFTAHTADTSAHFSGDEKENLDSLATNIAAISGITSTNVNNWDTAATSAHNHSNKSTLDAITASSAAINSLTGTVGTMAFENVNSYSSATQINTALSGKANSSDVYDKSETSGATELSTEFALYTKKADVDQVIDSTTSASTEAVSTSAVYGFVTAYTPSITVDQTIDSTTSASTNPVATKAVYSALTELNEVEVNSGDTPTSNSIELWVDESIDPVTVEVYTKAETNALLNDKSDKTATVSNVSYDSETGKLQKTINGTTTDVVSVVNSGFKFELNNGILNLIPIGTATAVVEDGILKLTF